MMRGINHQNISDLRSSLLTLDNAQASQALYSLNRSLEDEEDNWQFINTLDRMRMRTDDNGLPCGTNCTYYGYCLMTNHFHLLIREREEKVGETG